MNIKDDIFINQIIQDVKTIEEGKDWFNKLEPEYQREILGFIGRMSRQARANEADVDLAIRNSKLKPTYTPCVLLKKGELNLQISKILNLPMDEYNKTFVLFINLFKIADERRRVLMCKGNCSHWWHKDLSSEKVIEQILESYKSGAL
jgi:hypothetical protein